MAAAIVEEARTGPTPGGTVTAKVCIMAPLAPLREPLPLIVELKRGENAKTARWWSLRGASHFAKSIASRGLADQLADRVSRTPLFFCAAAMAHAGLSHALFTSNPYLLGLSTSDRAGCAVRCAAELFLNALESNAACLLYTSPSPRDRTRSRMPSSA